MNAALTTALSFGLTILGMRGEIIARWDFNGTNRPSSGLGTAALIGGVSAAFATGSTNDPAPSSVNRGWNTSAYPGQGLGNKTAGVQFNVSTVGFAGIRIRWDHRVSTTASKHCRLQYSADGLQFLDAEPPIVAHATSASGRYFEPESVDLASIAALDDNPNFGFRIVSEFEQTASGSGSSGYVATYSTNNYSRSGTIRFDMLEVSGNPIPGANTPPRISPIQNQTVRANQSTPGLPFTIADDQDLAESLALEVFSSDAAVVPRANLVFGGLGTNRTIALTSGPQPGVCMISLTVIDTGGLSATTSFSVTVLPTNTPPTISGLRLAHSVVDTPPGLLTFTIGDEESPTDTLAVSAASSNPTLVPNDLSHLALGGTGSNRTVALVPAPGQTGIAPIRIAVSDGASQTVASFPYLVTPSPAVILCEPFSYPDGSLLSNSAFFWSTRSGVPGECHTSNGQVLITSDQTEDISAPLLNGPFTPGNGVVLYTSFRLKFLSVPKTRPDYFAHFVGGTSLRARVYASASDALPGCFYLSIANGSPTNTLLGANLATNASYTIVSRYDIDRAVATLWINPARESDPSVTASDGVQPVTISEFGFRQDSGLGATALIDDLVVGLKFDAVVCRAPHNLVPLKFERIRDAVVLRWSASDFLLQAAGECPGPFTNVPDAVSPFTNKALSPAERFFRLKSL